MSTNVSIEFDKAQKEYLNAQNDNEKLKALEKLISAAPSHKGAENLRADIRRRLKKLKERLEQKRKKKKSSGKEGIKKEEMQAVLIGFTNSGKSSLLSSLTNAFPKVSNFEFTTKSPIIGTLNYHGASIQIVDVPAVNFESFDTSIPNFTDLLLIIVTNPKEIEQISPFLQKSHAKRLIVLNKIDLLSQNDLRRYSAQLQSKKYNFVVISTKTNENLEELKEKIFLSFDKIRVYTKNDKKLDDRPIILDSNSNVKDVAEKIRKNLSLHIKETKITGPSSKFPNQRVSLSHILRDKDMVEFKFD